MNKWSKALIQRLREVLYLLVSLPISVLLFSFVIFGLNGITLIPLAILVFLFLLTAMEPIASFEIRRTNKILGTDFPIVAQWFERPFFSWDGVKERVTSLRSWMAISYIFVAFGASIFSFVLLVFGISGLALILVVSGVVVLSSFSRSFKVVDGGDRFEGKIQFVGQKLTLEFGDGLDSGTLTYNVQSWLTLVVGILLAAIALWLIPRNTRNMAKIVEGLLSGGFYSSIHAKIAAIQQNRRVKKGSVREAIADEVSRPELAELSKREREILALMAEGKSNAGIAKALYITEGSVEKHISSILSKLGLSPEEDSHRRVLAVLAYLGISKHS